MPLELNIVNLCLKIYGKLPDTSLLPGRVYARQGVHNNLMWTFTVSSGKRQLKPLVEGKQSLFPRVFRIVISTGSPDAMPRLAWPLNLKFIFIDEIMFEKVLICGQLNSVAQVGFPARLGHTIKINAFKTTISTVNTNWISNSRPQWSQPRGQGCMWF